MRKVLKWIGNVLGAIVGLLVLVVIAVFVISGTRINKRYDVAVESITIPTDEAIDYYGQQNDEDLAAIFTYLQTLPAMEQGY